jgi:hypothetical protein
MKTKEIGLCKLCKKEKILVDSHIFPEFMYKPMYDNKQQYMILSTNSSYVQKKRKGIYDRLFCMDCEAIIGKYETYAAKVLVGDGKHQVDYLQTKLGMEYLNIDYALFKLFQMSLFWRASLSTRKELSPIHLGEHQEFLRKMILAGTPGKYNQYASILSFSPNYTQHMIDGILPPEQLHETLPAIVIYRAIFNGIVWHFFLSENLIDIKLNTYFLSEDGVLPLVDGGDNVDALIINYMTDFFKNR